MPGTVIDRLTGLQWEQKTADGTAHDNNNAHTWSAGAGGLTGDSGRHRIHDVPADTERRRLLRGNAIGRPPTSPSCRRSFASRIGRDQPGDRSDLRYHGPDLYHYWSVTADPKYPRTRWVVYFDNGLVFGELMDSNVYVRGRTWRLVTARQFSHR